MSTKWIQTFTHKKFFPLNPDPKLICIEDIAHALSNQCRYTGHCRSFYSVADHSVHCSEMAYEFGETSEIQKYCFCHDFAEAYITDFADPIKRNPKMAFYLKVEEKLERVIYPVFGLEYPNRKTKDIIRHYDLKALATEKRDLMDPEADTWGPLPDPDEGRIIPLLPPQAEELFLARYEELFYRLHI
jgi:uncharacterized protein